jgi:hypothetical protein
MPKVTHDFGRVSIKLTVVVCPSSGYISASGYLIWNKVMSKRGLTGLLAAFVALGGACVMSPVTAGADNISEDVAFPEKFMLRLGYYNVEGADTQVTVFNNAGLGVGYSFSRDFGGDDSASSPRIDMYYRINERHRVDFSTFNLNRDGIRTLELLVELGDEVFSIGEELNSEISYDLYRLGYSYSFFHSDRVELAISAGLNVTKYDMEFKNKDGSKISASDATAPLPMWGLRMGYAINANWSLHYLTETFYIEIEDTYKGTLFNNEVNVQYRFLDNFVVGAGVTRVSTDLEVNDSDWKGGIVDSHNGYLVFAGFYF